MDQWTSRLAPQLRALVALDATGGHMTQAASELDIPQSSMSRRISSLEASLGVPLLIHDGRAVRLTSDARRLATQARAPLDELDRALAEVTGGGDSDRGTVRFGFPLTMGSGAIPDLLADFRREHPGIRVLLKQAHGSELNANLLAGDLDLAVVIPAPEQLSHVMIGTQTIYAVVPTDHALAHARSLPLAQLRAETFIANPPSYNLRQLTETWCRAAGYIPAIGIEVTEFATIRELIGRGLGIALLPHEDRGSGDTIEIPLSKIPLSEDPLSEDPLSGGSYTRTIGLATATTTQSPHVRRFHNFLIEGLT